MAKLEYIRGEALSHSNGTSGSEQDSVFGHVAERYRGTSEDHRDMRVLGKRQVLKRNWGAITMLAFSSMVAVAWEVILCVEQFPLTNGGTPTLFWGVVIGPIVMTFVYMSLAEMVSM